MSVALAALCAVMLLAAARELVTDPGEQLGPAARRLRTALARLLLPATARTGAERLPLVRAGVPGLDPRLLPLARGLCAVCALPLAFELAPVAPGHSGALVLAGLPVAGGLLPGLLLERMARRRRARIEAALPDALELMAVGAASGAGQRNLLAHAAQSGAGPLREELLAAVAEIECGASPGPALDALARRTGGEVAALSRLLDRSRRLGSPLAEGLQEQAVMLRERRAREITEHADRAAPKIQLVVALLLVPSVLLLVAAAVLANADALLVGL